jgi:hypothetical protein
VARSTTATSMLLETSWLRGCDRRMRASGSCKTALRQPMLRPDVAVLQKESRSFRAGRTSREIGRGHGRRVNLRKSKLGDGAQWGVLDMHRLLACFRGQRRRGQRRTVQHAICRREETRTRKKARFDEAGLIPLLLDESQGDGLIVSSGRSGSNQRCLLILCRGRRFRPCFATPARIFRTQAHHA